MDMEQSRGPERTGESKELREMLSHPEQVFDSDQKKAQLDWEKLQKRLRQIEGRQRIGSSCAIEITEGLGSKGQVIKIIWPVRGREPLARMLQLDPVKFGNRIESDFIGYNGTYGLAELDDNQRHTFVPTPDKTIPVSRLWNIPTHADIIIKPTPLRWAIGRDETSIALGDNYRTLYIGLGFLLIGEQWMHIGGHEAGHIPTDPQQDIQPNENIAWQSANREYARAHKPRKNAILSGSTHGRFDLLQKTEHNINLPSIGQIMRYGLTSHYAVGTTGTHIPQSWIGPDDVILKNTRTQFTRVIKAAEEQYEYFIGR